MVISDSEGSHAYTMSEFFKHRHVFLPSQDYLQKLISEENVLSLLCGFEDFIIKQVFIESDITSIEQLWLAYVMDKLYNKIWNGSEWIINDKEKLKDN